MSRKEILKIVKAARYLGVRKVRITGGEPLLRKDLTDICRDIRSIKEIRELCITTNGSMLKDSAEELKDAGVDRINISLDTTDTAMFRKITGGSINSVFEGIEACYSAGYVRLSLNAVIMRSSCSPEDIGRLINFAKKNPIDLRFIELMPMQDNKELFEKEYLPYSEVMDSIGNVEYYGTTGTSITYKIPDSESTVGFIPALSRPFCSECSRIRVTADGRLKPCLHDDTEYDLLQYKTVSELKTAMRKMIYDKPYAHRLSEDGISDSRRSMVRIGG